MTDGASSFNQSQSQPGRIIKEIWPKAINNNIALGQSNKIMEARSSLMLQYVAPESDLGSIPKLSFLAWLKDPRPTQAQFWSEVGSILGQPVKRPILEIFLEGWKS